MIKRHTCPSGTFVCSLCGMNVTGMDMDSPCYGVPKMTSPSDLTAERHSTHGDWLQQSTLANVLKIHIHESYNWRTLQPYQREAIDMIAVKLSRILCGNPDEPDHWDDIAGYAFLGKGGHTPS